MCSNTIAKSFFFFKFAIIANVSNLNGNICQSLRGFFLENGHFRQLAVHLNEVSRTFGTVNGYPQTA